ncbi:hypothetical protein M9978_08555 [Sphingomonas sp. MG17]|uniref:Rap1a immunity protein domain-containing protein n=1 Tax=Sphingomonas tagetis TaxID=2949092 RepID=A0A9X2KKG1_9SPHN|nr:hypothetical protein [Sphingomonas tagetis]MCP3730479.1 hypothetical protein [Sphingomonas tagetis]
MKKLMMIAALVALPASAQAMSVAEFLAKVSGLKAKGLFAMGSPDIKLLTTEMKAVGEAYRTDIEGARAAGRTPHSCPPPKGKAKLTSKDLLSEFEAIPAAQRGMSVKTAFYAMMRKRYPCK